jgi:PhnB protein
MAAEVHPRVISVMLAVPDAAAAAKWYARALVSAYEVVCGEAYGLTCWAGSG